MHLNFKKVPPEVTSVAQAAASWFPIFNWSRGATISRIEAAIMLDRSKRQLEVGKPADPTKETPPREA